MIPISPELRAELSRRIRAEAAANASLKLCPACKQEVPLSEWTTRRGHPSGLQTTCMSCASAYRRSTR